MIFSFSRAKLALMKITTYLNSKKMSQANFAESLNVSAGMVTQWLNGHRPISPERCVEIEQVTGGMVTRKDLRPKDWKKIWPELAEKKAA